MGSPGEKIAGGGLLSCHGPSCLNRADGSGAFGLPWAGGQGSGQTQVKGSGGGVSSPSLLTSAPSPPSFLLLPGSQGQVGGPGQRKTSISNQDGRLPPGAAPLHHTCLCGTILQYAPLHPLCLPGLGLRTPQGLCSAAGVAPEGSQDEPGASESALSPHPPMLGYEFMKEVPRRGNAHILPKVPSLPLTLGLGGQLRRARTTHSPRQLCPSPDPGPPTASAATQDAGER